VDKSILRILLDPLIHPGVDDVGLIIVLPCDALVGQDFEDRLCTARASRIQLPSVGLDGVIDQSTRGSRGGELPIGIRRSWVFGVIAVPESEVLS